MVPSVLNHVWSLEQLCIDQISTKQYDTITSQRFDQSSTFLAAKLLVGELCGEVTKRSVIFQILDFYIRLFAHTTGTLKGDAVKHAECWQKHRITTRLGDRAFSVAGQSYSIHTFGIVSPMSFSRVIARRIGGTRGKAVPIVNVFKNALWTALRTIFRAYCARLQDFAYIQSQNVFGGSTQESRRSALGAWTQTPMSAWLASVSIFLLYQTTTRLCLAIILLFAFCESRSSLNRPAIMRSRL